MLDGSFTGLQSLSARLRVFISAGLIEQQSESRWAFEMLPQLKKFIFDELVFVDQPEQFGEDDDLLEAGLDSMGIMRLVLFIEQELGVILPDHEIAPENLRTLNAIRNWVTRHQ